LDENCEEYTKGAFLLDHGEVFYCPRCRMTGHMEGEKTTFSEEEGVFGSVRLEYDFDPLQWRYRSIAIVKDEALIGEVRTCTIKSPLVKTPRRALKVAEHMLGHLRQTPDLKEGEPITGAFPTKEITISFDHSGEGWKADLEIVAKAIKGLEEPRCQE
jgi:hypothetical protein